MKAKYVLLAVGVVLALLFVTIEFAREYGYQEGLSEAKRECLENKLSDSEQALNAFAKAAEQATERVRQADRALSESIAAQELRDEKTTRDIKNALKKSAGGRINCVFDSDSMQQLSAARDRAAAAVTRGINRELPSTAIP
ncbi:hypothetical protein FHU11_4845 [Serratia fonticola]|nr:hypothetical protein [Serratia fonticola]TQI99263.1 hypothetical protein FHU11_4845 [Serratia fonticola]